MANAKCIGRGEEELAALLESAWPGVRVNRLDFNPWDRGPSDDEFSVSLSFSGPLDALVQHGLLEPSVVAAIPRSGHIYRSRFSVNRGKHLMRVTCYWVDPDDDDKPREQRIQRIVDCVAKAVASDMLSVLHG